MKRKEKDYFSTVPVPLRKVVSKAVGDYRWELGMQMWELDVSYAHEDKEAEIPGDDVAASISLNRRYLEGVVTIYPNLVKRWVNKKYDENRIREIIAHEVSHIATQHFFDVATARYCDDGEMRDAWETCTTVIGRLVHKLSKKA